LGTSRCTHTHALTHSPTHAIGMMNNIGVALQIVHVYKVHACTHTHTHTHAHTHANALANAHNNHRFGEMNGIDVALQCVALYKGRDQGTAEEGEFMQARDMCVFPSCRCAVTIISTSIVYLFLSLSILCTRAGTQELQKRRS